MVGQEAELQAGEEGGEHLFVWVWFVLVVGVWGWRDSSVAGRARRSTHIYVHPKTQERYLGEVLVREEPQQRLHLVQAQHFLLVFTYEWSIRQSHR